MYGIWRFQLFCCIFYVSLLSYAIAVFSCFYLGIVKTDSIRGRLVVLVYMFALFRDIRLRVG